MIVALIFGFAPVAQAHTDFEYSDPTDGAVISVAVDEVRIGFTAESLVAGDGFVVLTPTGDIISPEFTVSADQREFTLLFDPPLVDGVVGVQWSVRAGDAHPIEGAFSFTTTATATPTELQPAVESADAGLETVVGPETDSELVAEPVEGDVYTAAAPESALPAPIETAPLLGADAAVPESPESEAAVLKPEAVPKSETALAFDDGEVTGAAVGASAISMNDFLNVDDSSGLAGPVGFAGRLATQAGSLIAIGVVAFALLVSAQSPGEMQVFVNLLRQAAVATILGAIVEAVGLVMSLASVSDALLGSAGVAILLRLAGAAGLIAATTGALTIATGATEKVTSRERSLVDAGGAFSGAVRRPENGPPMDVPVVPRRESIAELDNLAWWFAGLLALSYVFDGHTVTKGNRLLTGIIDLVHVGGGAVWLGGLVCLLVLSRSRRAKLDAANFIETIVRFSVVAAVALGAVGVAGLALTVTILDSVSELWSTAWGRLLIAKVLTVAIAVGAGAFNHFVLVPELQSISAHSDARESFLRTLRIEVAALGAALLVTAALVAAAS